MNKTELIEAIAKSTKLSKADVTRVIDALFETFSKTLKKGAKISLVGYLTLEKVKRKATTGRNPRTGAAIKIPAKNVVKVKAGSKLQEAVS